MKVENLTLVGSCANNINMIGIILAYSGLNKESRSRLEMNGSFTVRMEERVELYGRFLKY